MGLGKGKRIVGFAVSYWDFWKRGLVLEIEIEGEFQNAKLLHPLLVVFDPLLSQLLVPSSVPFLFDSLSHALHCSFLSRLCLTSELESSS